MSTIDEIISAGIELGEQIAAGYTGAGQERVMRARIAAALADARREGAEQMREAEARDLVPDEFAVSESPRCLQGGDACEGCLMIGKCIGGSPKQPASEPTGQRQVARLTDEQIGRAIARGVSVEYQTPGTSPAEVAMHGMLMSMGRSIESAVLAANGLEGGAA